MLRSALLLTAGLCTLPSILAAQAAAPFARRVGALTPPGAKEALRGALSRDGQRFVYEVVDGDERQLWLMETASGKRRPLTSSPGVRLSPAWSPNGELVAYSRSQPFSRADQTDDGLWVLNVGSGVERLVYPRSRLPQDVFLDHPSWTSDTTLAFWAQPFRDDNAPNTEVQVWRVTLRGGPPTQLTSSPLRHWGGEFPILSPNGRWIASSGLCCGGAQTALIVRGLSDSTVHCLAGPLGSSGFQSSAWSADGRTLYLASSSLSDSTPHVYRVRRLDSQVWSRPERIDHFDQSAVSVSSSQRNQLAVVLRSDSSLRGDLWLLAGADRRPPNPKSELHACPEPPGIITSFVKRTGLPAVRDVSITLEIPRLGLSFFGVSYGREMDWGVYQHAIGLLYGHRIGWIAIDRSGYTTAEADSVRQSVELFPLRANDAPLMSRWLLDTLDKDHQWLADVLRGFITRNRATPIPVLGRLVRSRGNDVVHNERILEPGAPWGELKQLAVLAPQIAEAVLDRPDVRDNPERLFAIGQLPAYRGDGLVRWMVTKRFRRFADLLLKDPETPEPMLIQLYFSLRAVDDTAGFRRLYQYPATQRSATLMTLFASELSRDPRSPNKLAQGEILRFGFWTVEDAKLAFIRRVRAEPALPSGSFPRAVEMAGLNLKMLMELYQIRGRDSVAERSVREYLAGSQAPLSFLRILAESLRVTPHYGVASNLLMNETARKDRRILEIIAHLDPEHGRNMIYYADSLLRTLPPERPRTAP